MYKRQLQDFARAQELICGAADAGDANGQFNCGLLYAEGKGVARDDAEAVRLWEAAAHADHVAAINYLATAYRDGNGVGADMTRAVELFERTASAGNPLGLYELAQAYSSGTGVEVNLTQAHMYANLAAVRGVEDALALRDQLSVQLSAEDLATAQERARVWQAAPLADATSE